MSTDQQHNLDGAAAAGPMPRGEPPRCSRVLAACVAAPLWLALTLAAWAQTPSAQTATARAAPSCAATQAAAPAETYVRSSQVDMLDLLSPPPDEHSAAEQRDLQAVLEAQRAARAQHELAHAISDATVTCGHFADVLGAALNGERAALALAFLNRAAQQGAALTGPVKQHWHRKRPYAVSDRVERLADMSPNAPLDVTMRSACGPNAKLPSRAAAAQALARVSYPSGHSVFGTVCSILLADMVPEKRAQLFARGRDYGHSRLVVGAHFPTDVEAGRIVGTIAVALMMQNPRFQHDYAEARAQLRSALGLPDAVSSAAASVAPASAAPAAVTH